MNRARQVRKRKIKRARQRVKRAELKQRVQEMLRDPASCIIRKLIMEFLLERIVVGVVEGKKRQITKRGKLTLGERIQLYVLRYVSRKGINEIAKILGRHGSTVSRELKRNRPVFLLHGMDSYSQARYAQDRADRRRSANRRRMRLKTQQFRIFVELGLKNGLSPQAISLRMELELGQSVSHEAIYQWLYREHRTLIAELPRGGKKYHRRASLYNSRKKRKQPAAPKTSIEKRPCRANERLEFGHWEMDTIVSKQSKTCLLVLQERVSRYFFVILLPSCSADEAFKAVYSVLSKLEKEWVKSITCDNGSENFCHDKITQKLGIPVYFCHPYCASERGGVENRNGTLRRFFPKKTNFSNVSIEQLEAVRHKLLRRPMKCLNYLTPNEIFTGVFEPQFKMAA